VCLLVVSLRPVCVYVCFMCVCFFVSVFLLRALFLSSFVFVCFFWLINLLFLLCFLLAVIREKKRNNSHLLKPWPDNQSQSCSSFLACRKLALGLALGLGVCASVLGGGGGAQC
jgi:hypothetical protein